MDEFLWWRDGVIYQVYPRSFADSNGDGLGDLPGIISHLDYLSDLGVDAIWLSPIHPSPDKDFGYDISDHCAIDPRFGTLSDFNRLISDCHARGIRVVMDMVMNHTSNEHPWFKESRSSCDNPKRDWYIWRPSRNGRSRRPPNNWQSSFGGETWEYDPASGEHYLHLFTREQPDLNWRNPQVRQAQLDVFRFWLERGVDGFRLDVFNAYFKHSDLPDNPWHPGLRGFDRQKHLYDFDQPEMVPFLQELRQLLEKYPERYAVGETYVGSPEKSASYCGPDKLHAAFSFEFTSMDLHFPIYPWKPGWLARRIQRREIVFSAAGIWPTNVMSNHDLPRAAYRYTNGQNDSQSFLAMALLLTLRGTPFMYYGEEIGMRDIQLSRREILDPPGKKYWPLYKGRDGCRSPMQWDASLNGGFSTGKPWLPVNPDYTQRNVLAQQADPDSLFNFTKKLLSLRKSTPALSRGDYLPHPGPRGTLAFLRRLGNQAVFVVMNFTNRKISYRPPNGDWVPLLSTSGGQLGHLAQQEIQFFISH